MIRDRSEFRARGPDGKFPRTACGLCGRRHAAHQHGGVLYCCVCHIRAGHENFPHEACREEYRRLREERELPSPSQPPRPVDLARLAGLVDHLPHREREVVRLRVGLPAPGDPFSGIYSGDEIARIFKVTRARVRQVWEGALRVLVLAMDDPRVTTDTVFEYLEAAALLRRAGEETTPGPGV